MPYFLLLNLVLGLMSDFLLKSGHVGIIFGLLLLLRGGGNSDSLASLHYLSWRDEGFLVTHGQEWEFWLPTRPLLITLWLGGAGASGYCPPCGLHHVDVALLLLSGGEKLDSPLGLL